MAEGSYNEFVELVTKALKTSARGQGPALDGKIDKLEKLWEMLLKRKDILDSLKSKTEAKAKEWVPPVHQVDFLSRSERDFRMRFRSRVSAIRSSAKSHELGVASLEKTGTILDTISGK